MSQVTEEIKNRISCLDYARNILNINVRKPGDRWTSFRPGSKNKTCCIFYEDWFFDHNLKIGGNVINLCAYAKYGGKKSPAIRELSSLCGIQLNNNPKWEEKTSDLCNMIELYHQELTKEHREYLHQRGFTDETINRNKLGTKGNSIIIPCFENGYVAYYTMRNFDKSPKYRHMPKSMAPAGELIPWGFHTLTRVDKPLIITEGVFDAMVCDQEGYQTLSPLGGAFNKTLYKEIISICKSVPEVILIFDKDANGAGQEFLYKMAKKLFSFNIDFGVYQFKNNEDLNEYYQREKSISAIETNKVRGVEYLAETIKDKDEFKNFVYNASKFVDKATMSELFDIASLAENDFRDGWLKEVKKGAMSCPSEDSIVKEVLDKKELVFKKGLGFFEYSSGCWRSREEEEIQGYISDALGYYRTGAKIKTICNLIKSEVITSEDFNGNHIVNFLNGTLDLVTRELRQHEKSDMSSIQMTYAYDEHALCPNWLEFIDTITENDREKVELLQEMAGYVLFPTNHLQKCPVLIGGGANGKSVYLDILRLVYNAKNCTTIDMSNLNDEFQKIRLMSSLLNISTEMKTSVKGTENIFKQIVAGDPISGCKKHQDHIEFIPRTKMFFATNKMFKVKDLTYGYFRRLIFIKFNLEFKEKKEDIINKSYQRLANTNLSFILEQELPGIFNWCYDGYIKLQKRGKFSESKEHKYLLQEMIKAEDIHHTFFSTLKKNEYTESEIYSEYMLWCSEESLAAKSKPELLFMADSGTNKKFVNGQVIYMKR